MIQRLLDKDAASPLEGAAVHVHGVDHGVLDGVHLQVEEGVVRTPHGLHVHRDASLGADLRPAVFREQEALVERVRAAEHQPDCVGQLLVVFLSAPVHSRPLDQFSDFGFCQEGYC